jgi:pimeloyl-ACP methyl ester carboxylesterase
VERPIICERTVLAGIPILHVRARSLSGAAPTILYAHGWMSAKERNIIPAECLAIDGFRVIVPDRINHGERGALPEYDAALPTHFWPTVLTAIAEAEQLKDAAVAAGWADPDRVGMAGYSMGGFITAGAMARHPWIKAAAFIAGCPCYCWGEAFYTQKVSEQTLAGLRSHDPEQLADRFAPRPLLMLHGDADKSVPIDSARRFLEKARPYYAACPERLQMVEFPGLVHAVSNHEIEQMRNWFVRWL